MTPSSLTARSSPRLHSDLDFDAAGHPVSRRCGARYRWRIEEARRIFVEGCGLRRRWRGRERFSVVATGFGLGVNLLATLAAWRSDPDRPARLDFVAIEPDPLDAAELALAHAAAGIAGTDAATLARQWPRRLPGLHRTAFDDGRVVLTLAIGDAERLAGLLPVAADAFFLDGFTPERNPAMWTPGLITRLARRARVGATLAAAATTSAVRESLARAGFEGMQEPDDDSEPIFARYAPRWRGAPPPPPPLSWPERTAIVVGAGIAGCNVADALARRGWRVTLLEAGDAVAMQGSGQPALAHHLHVAPDDNPLARLSRAALLFDRGQRPEETPAGRLQVASSDEDFENQLDCVRALGFPADFIGAVDRAGAADLAGVPLSRGGLWLPDCGWAGPLQRCQALLDSGAERIILRTASAVAALRRDTTTWQALSDDGRVLAGASVLVLANAGDAPRLAAQRAIELRRTRGQTTWLPGGLPGVLKTVLGGDAYVCPQANGRVLVGSSHDDGEALVADRAADLDNLARLAGMLEPGRIDPAALHPECRSGPVGFRYVTRDRLPMIGALPDEALVRADPEPWMRNDRLPLPMLSGVFGAFGFGSRGLLWGALAAEVLACAIDGGVAPLETDLLDAIAPARALRHQLRRRQLR